MFFCFWQFLGYIGPLDLTTSSIILSEVGVPHFFVFYFKGCMRFSCKSE